MCHLQVTYWFFSHGNIWIQLHLVKLLVGFQIIIIILVFITVSHIHGKTAIKISIPSTSTTTSYTQENLRVFFFFFSWTVTQMWALEDQSFIFLTFDVFFKPLPCLSWCFNFTLKFSTVFCMCMSFFKFLRAFLRLNTLFLAGMHPVIYNGNQAFFCSPHCSCFLCVSSVCLCV